MGRMTASTAQATATLLLLSLAGCNSLPAGHVESLQQDDPPKVILLRGWRGLYSKGIDDLAASLHGRGVTTAVYRHDQWEAVAKQVQDDVSIIGFSYGADDAIRLSRQLARRSIKVPLLITIDPVTPPSLADNVGRAVNFYQSNGPMDVFPWLRGVPIQDARVANYDLRTHRKDLFEPGTSHATIAANRKLHGAIIELVVGERASSATLPVDDP